MENPMQTALTQAMAAGMLQNSIEHLDIKGVPFVVTPPEFKLNELKHLQARPVRCESTVSVQSVEAFIAYFNRFADADSTIFVDYDGQRITGVIDYHAMTGMGSGPYPIARFGRHRVVYQFNLTPEAERWVSNDKKPMDQTAFATFIEDNMPEIVAPDAARMLEIAKSLNAKTGVDFRSHIRLDNGEVQFQYNETIQGSAGVAGNLQIPTKLVLGIQLFRGSSRYAIDTNFRYRLQQGKLTMWYELIRFHTIRDDAVAAVMGVLQERIVQGQIIEATAVAAQ